MMRAAAGLHANQAGIKFCEERYQLCPSQRPVKGDLFIFCNPVNLKNILGDLPPEAPSFITRVCGFGFHIFRRQFEQARHARSPQIAQALDHCRQWFATQTMRGRFSGCLVAQR
jgi:hypothetical protein